jgi:hypothetical protein
MWKWLLVLIVICAPVRANDKVVAAEPSLCQFVLRALKQGSSKDRVQTAVEAVIRYGKDVLEHNDALSTSNNPAHSKNDRQVTLSQWDRLYAVRGRAYSFHARHSELYWALQLPSPTAHTVWRKFSTRERVALVGEVAGLIAQHGKYTDHSVEEFEGVARRQLGNRRVDLLKTAHWAKAPTSTWETVKLIGTVLSVINNTEPVFEGLFRAQRGLAPQLSQASANEEPPTAMSPAAYCANALAGGSSGVCRHASEAVVALSGELGAPAKTIRVQFGVGLVGHAWVCLRDVGPRGISFDPTPESTGHYSLIDKSLPQSYFLLMPLFRNRGSQLLDPVFEYRP